MDQVGELGPCATKPRVWGGGSRRGRRPALGLCPKGPPSPYIKAALLPCSSFIPFSSSPPLLSSPLPWFPLFGAGIGRLEVPEVLPPSGCHRATGFLVRSLLLPLCLCWTGARRTFLHRTCVELRRCHSFGTSSSSSRSSARP